MITTVLCYSTTSSSSVADYGPPSRVDMAAMLPLQVILDGVLPRPADYCRYPVLVYPPCHCLGAGSAGASKSGRPELALHGNAEAVPSAGCWLGGRRSYGSGCDGSSTGLGTRTIGSGVSFVIEPSIPLLRDGPCALGHDPTAVSARDVLLGCFFVDVPVAEPSDVTGLLIPLLFALWAVDAIILVLPSPESIRHLHWHLRQALRASRNPMETLRTDHLSFSGYMPHVETSLV